MVYIAGLFTLYFGLFLGWLSRYRGRFLVVLALLILGAIAVFRGDVGTDTLNYERMVGHYRGAEGFDGREPGFVALLMILAAVFGSDPVVVRFASVVIVGIILLFIARADHDELFFLFAYIIPAFFYQYSMNALRIGLGSALLLLAVQYRRRLCQRRSVVVGVSALAFHYSTLVSLVYLWMVERRWVSVTSAAIALFCAVLIGGMVYLNFGYFMEKGSLYADYGLPSELSGLSKIVVVMIVLAGVLFSRLPRADKAKIVGMGGALCLIFWGIASVSYAGLRFLDLLSFAMPLSVLSTFGRCRMRFDIPIKISLMTAGLVAAAAVYRGFMISESVGPTPFLPYETIW